MPEHIWQFIADLMKTNQFLAGGFILGILAAVLHQCKAWPRFIWDKIKSRFFVEVEVSDRDEAFLWMVKWLAAHPYGKDRARLLMATTERPKDNGRPTSVDETHDTRPRIILSPARGHHWFFYKRRLVFLYRGKADEGGDAKDKMFQPETITIKILSRNRQIIMELLEDARDIAYPVGEKRISIMVFKWGSWSPTMYRRPRPVESVILRKGLMENMIHEIRQFIDAEKWYVERGIPYRLGILLSGPPGSGKSSTIAAVASHFDMDLAIINLAASSMDDDDLRNMLSDVNSKSMVMIEDIDCVFHQREATDDKENKVTFSGLLNAIDGVAAGEGRILWMTTNHPENLDPALIRAGRADLRFEIGNPDASQVCRMFERFFPDSTPSQTLRFVEAIGDPTKTSMAALQGVLTQHKNDPEAAIKHAK